MANKRAIAFSLILLSTLHAARRPCSAAEVVFRDEFNNPQLTEGWSIIREDPSTYSLTANPGFFRVQTVRGILGSAGTARNLLVRPMSGDFIIETRLVFDPRDGQPFGGLIAYQDDANAVSVGLVFASGERGEFRGVIMLNVGDDIDPAASGPAARYDESNALDPKIVYLRLLRQGDQFVGAFSDDGVIYQDLGTVTNTLSDTLLVGVGAANGDTATCGPACDVPIPADFDFFQASTIDGDGGGDGPGTEVTLESVEISGPDEVVGGTSAAFTATALFSDGTSSIVSQDADWLIAPLDVGTIVGGVLSARPVSAVRPATVVVSYSHSAPSGAFTRTAATVIRIVTRSSQSGSPRMCGTGILAFLPMMCMPYLCWRRR